MARIWCRRMAAYMLRMILPTSLLSQLLGTVLFGRSDPDGICGSWIVCVSAVVVCLISVLSTRDGRSWAHRLLNLQVVDRSSLLPVSRVRMAVLVVGAGRHGRVGSVGDGHVQQRLHVIDLIAGDGGIERAGMVFPVEPGEGGVDLPELIGREILDGRLGGGVQRVCGGVRGRRGQRRRGQRDGRPGRQGDAQRDRDEPVPAVRAGADADDVPHIVSFSYGRGRMPRPPPPRQGGE